MAEWATVDDVIKRYEGVITTERRDWVDTLIPDAEAVLRDELPSLPARINDGRTSTETVTRVVCNLVIGVLRNPGGYTSQSAGEFSYSYAGNPTAAGGMALSGADRRALVGRPRANTVPAHDPQVRRPHVPDTTP